MTKRFSVNDMIKYIYLNNQVNTIQYYNTVAERDQLLYDFLNTVRAASHECVIRIGQP